MESGSSSISIESGYFSKLLKVLECEKNLSCGFFAVADNWDRICDLSESKLVNTSDQQETVQNLVSLIQGTSDIPKVNSNYPDATYPPSPVKVSSVQLKCCNRIEICPMPE